MERYLSAKKKYEALGVDVEKAISTLKDLPVSLHCWQGDDVIGFDHDGPLTGGIQTTGNYPGKARNWQELMADMEKVISLCPGKKKLNVHACYAIFEDGFVDRDKIEPKHFAKWVELAKKLGVGIDFNPTFFSHPFPSGPFSDSSHRHFASWPPPILLTGTANMIPFPGRSIRICLRTSRISS